MTNSSTQVPALLTEEQYSAMMDTLIPFGMEDAERYGFKRSIFSRESYSFAHFAWNPLTTPVEVLFWATDDGPIFLAEIMHKGVTIYTQEQVDEANTKLAAIFSPADGSEGLSPLLDR